MIEPRRHNNRVSRQVKAFLSTLVLAAFCYGILIVSEAEPFRVDRTFFREIDLDQLSASYGWESVMDLFESSSAGAEDTSLENEINRASSFMLEEVSPSQLLSADTIPLVPAPVNPATSEPVTEGSSAQPVDPGIVNQRPQLAESSPSAEVVPDTENDPPAESLLRPEQATSPELPGLSEEAPAEQPAAGGQPPGMTIRNPPLNSDRTAGTLLPEISRVSLFAMGRDFENLELMDITDWMSRNSSDLPIGIRLLIRHRDRFYSSASQFILDGKRYELYLMCKQLQYEMHIVLVEEDQALYLIDRSFQNLSRTLQRGEVSRDEERGIYVVKSLVAVEDSPEQFYAPFWSWWEYARRTNSR